MPKFPKPEEGSWTEHYPGLGTAPVSYKDSYDPDFWQQEIDTIFKKEWLNVGRVEQLPRIGSYFTKEFAWAKRSIIIVKDKDGTVRAFHNVCRHRGNKLVWDDYPQEETSGSCRQFTCKYHAWRYDLDGSLNFVQQESEFFDLDKENLGLIPVACDVWEGFIFVNLDDEPAQTLTEALDPFSEGLAGYPFGEMTQVYRAKSEVKANWKLFIDAFIEFYHAPILHMKQATAEEAPEARRIRLRGAALRHLQPALRRLLVGRHGAAEGSEHRQAVGERDAQRPVRSVGQARRDQQQREPAAAGQPGPPQVAWGTDTFMVWPNLMILIWEPGWYLTYHYWPTGPSEHLFETALYFVPPKNAGDRIAQEMAFSTFKEYAFQDANTLEATQSMIETGVVDTFVLNDQEVLCRHHHAAVREQVKAGGRRPATRGCRRPPTRTPEQLTTNAMTDMTTDRHDHRRLRRHDAGAEGTAGAVRRPRHRSPTGSSTPWRPRYEKRLASSMDEMQAFYDAILPRMAAIIEYMQQASTSTTCPTMSATSCC